MAQQYKGIIWTNHAHQRLGERGLSPDLAWQTIKYADSYQKGKSTGSWEFKKKFGNSTVTVIAIQNEKKEYVILSNWIDPPLIGSIDHKKQEYWKRYKKANFWGKFLLVLRKQIGL